MNIRITVLVVIGVVALTQLFMLATVQKKRHREIIERLDKSNGSAPDRRTDALPTSTVPTGS